jgi:hypothetical protein
MQHKSGQGDSEPDVEAALNELYTTPPPDFVSRREELASAAKAAGRVEDARRIHAARRPTRAAWAANLLLRSQPQESQQFLQLGQALREAYRALDADEIKELTEQRRRIVSTLSRQAAELAREAGHQLSNAAQQDVQSTLRAVLADPDAASLWAAGRLETALTPPSAFPPSTASAAGTSSKTPKPRARSSRTAAPSSARSGAKDELADRHRERKEQLAHARRAAEAAAHHLREKQAEQAEADAVLQQAGNRGEEARKHVAAAEQQLRQAREELRRADREQQEAEERRRAAGDALARAEKEARASTQAIDRLTARDR